MENEPLNLCGPPPATLTETKLAEPILDWIREERQRAEFNIKIILQDLEKKTGAKITAVGIHQEEIPTSNGTISNSPLEFTITLSV